MIKIVNEELVRMMGEANEELNLKTTPPAVVLMVGSAGGRKTDLVSRSSHAG